MAIVMILCIGSGDGTVMVKAVQGSPPMTTELMARAREYNQATPNIQKIRMRKRAKAFPHRFLISLLLLARLSRAPSPSIMITYSTRVNTANNMMPGTTRLINPPIIKVRVIYVAANNEASLDFMKLKAH